MVNKGQIHMELGKFLMIFSNLIKSNDKMWIEIRSSDIFERRLEDESTKLKITQFGSRFAEKSSNE